MKNIRTVNKDEIKERLIELGLEKGHLVMMHSSLSSMGYVVGGANAVIDAVLEALGNEGTLMVPTHTGCRTPDDPFDLYNTPSRMGKITEALRLRQGALRSFHPTHSDAATGALAYELVKDHQNTTPVGPVSPVGKLVTKGGFVLLLGVGFDSCTAIHVIEQMNHIPMNEDTAYVLNQGKAMPWPRKETPGHSGGFVKIETRLRENGLLKQTTIGNAAAILVKTTDLMRIGSTMLKETPEALLCDKSDCQRCQQTRAKMKFRVLKPAHD